MLCCLLTVIVRGGSAGQQSVPLTACAGPGMTVYCSVGGAVVGAEAQAITRDSSTVAPLGKLGTGGEAAVTVPGLAHTLHHQFLCFVHR